MADKAKEEEKPKDAKAAEGAEKKEGEAGAEGEAAPADEPKGIKKILKNKIVLFVALPLLVIILAGTGAFFGGLFDSFLPHKEPNCETVKEGDKDYEVCQAAAEAAGGEAAKPGAFIDVPDVIVNLNSSTKQPRFLKIALKIEVENEIELKKFEPLLPRVKDQFQMYLRELRIEDLRGTSGIYRMKIELLSRVRAAAPGVKVRDVLFQEILVQ